MTGQVLWVILIVLKGLKPSEATPNRTLRGSNENVGYRELNYFQASESAGCLRDPSFNLPSWCHLIDSEFLDDMNNLCNLGFKGNQRRIFAGMFFRFLDISFPLPCTSSFVVFHLEVPHFGHTWSLICLSQYNTQSLGQAWIFSYPKPNPEIIFFVS
jgi:hypothetical protein